MESDDINPDERSSLLGKCASDVSMARPSSGCESEVLSFDGKMVKSSTVADDLAATWGGRVGSGRDSGRLRRTQSWSGDTPDDASSEIRILRER